MDRIEKISADRSDAKLSTKSAASVQASNAMPAVKNSHKKTGRQTNNSLSSVMDVKDIKDAKDLKDVPSLGPRENGSKYRRIAPP